MCEQKAVREQIVYEDGVLPVAAALVENRAICFDPPQEADTELPYITTYPENAVNVLSRLPATTSDNLPSEVGEGTLATAVDMTQKIMSQVMGFQIRGRRFVKNPLIYAHEHLPDGSILIGNRVSKDASLLREQFDIGSDQRKEVEICAAVLGIGHELGHDITRQPPVVRLLTNVSPCYEPVVQAFNEWFLFSIDYSQSRLVEEQFATGAGYLVASIAAQQLHLVQNWNILVHKLMSNDHRILYQFSDLIALLRKYNGNPLSLSLGLSRLHAQLQPTHPDSAERIPQLGPYYIGYYTAINPTTIMQFFENYSYL